MDAINQPRELGSEPAASNTLRHADGSAPRRQAHPPLEERFVRRRGLLTTRYEFKEQPGRLAFSEGIATLKTNGHAPVIALAMVDRAAERGWATVRVSGSAEFGRAIWLAALAQGIKTVGYEPTQADKDLVQVQSRGKSLRLALAPAFAQEPGQAPNRETAVAPTRTHARAPNHVSTHTPAHTPTHSPTRTSTRTATRTPATAPEPRNFARDLSVAVRVSSLTPAPESAEAAKQAIERRGQLFDGAQASASQSENIGASLVRDWVKLDARDFARLTLEGDQQAGAARMSRNARSHTEYSVALQASDSTLAQRVTELDAASDLAGPVQGARRKAAQAEHPDNVRALDAPIAPEAIARSQGSGQKDPGVPGADDHDRDRGASAAGGLVGAAAVLRALEFAMEKHDVPAQLRPLVRDEVRLQLQALKARGVAVRVPIVDRNAPRLQAQVVAQHSHRDVSLERPR